MIIIKRVNDQTISVHYFISQSVYDSVNYRSKQIWKVNIEAIRMFKMLHLTNHLINKNGLAIQVFFLGYLIRSFAHRLN
jgi:hypothetical protein